MASDSFSQIPPKLSVTSIEHENQRRYNSGHPLTDSMDISRVSFRIYANGHPTTHAVAFARDTEKTLHQVIHSNLTSLGTSKIHQLTNVIFHVIDENPFKSLDEVSQIMWTVNGPVRRPFVFKPANIEEYGIYIPQLKKDVTKEDLFAALSVISRVINCQVDHFTMVIPNDNFLPPISCGYAYFNNFQEREKVLEKSSTGLLKIKGESVKCVPLKGATHEENPNKSTFSLVSVAILI